MTPLLSTTNLPALSLQSLSLRAAAVRASAPGSPLTVGRDLLAVALAFTRGSDDRESGWADNNQRLHFTGGCTFPGTTSLLASGASASRYSTDNGATWTASDS